jgi:hypothetical protein
MASSIIIGTSWINRKAKAAERGDPEALKQLQNQYVREVKRANERARNLDKHGLDTGALKQYRKNLDGNFISQSRNLEIDEMVAGLKKAEKFLKSQTSTVSGEMERRHKNYMSLTKPKRDKRGRIISQSFVKPPPEGMSKLQQERALNRFLSNKHFEELKKSLGTNVIKEAADAINQGIPVIRLSRLYNEYVRSNEKTDIRAIWSAFTTGEKHI